MVSKSIKSVCSLLLCVLLLFSVAPIMAICVEDNPTSGSCGINATWDYNVSTATLTISGTGAMSNYSTITTAPWGSYYDTIKTVIINSGVTSIGQYAFYRCTNLISVTIPDSVREISKSAFYDCDNLLSISIPDHVKSIGDHAFRGCTGLTRIDIPDSVTSIGNAAFSYCFKLSEVSIGKGVISIGDSAFMYCKSLTSVTIPDNVTQIGQGVFADCTELMNVTISQNVSVISQSAFNACTALESINIPDKTKSIGNYAFNDCKHLTRITIPEKVESIGNEAFSGCTGLVELIFNAKSAATSGHYSKVFYNAGTLSGGIAVVFGDTVEKIPDYLFYVLDQNGRPNVKTIAIDKNVNNIGDRSFYNCDKLTSVILPDYLECIGSGAFHGCSGLNSIIIPDGVQEIGNGAFYACSQLESVTIPSNITSINSSIFRDCVRLTSVRIGKKIEIIGRYAFCGCTNLSDVYYDGTQAMWDTITIESDNVPLLQASLHVHKHEYSPTLSKEPTCTEEGIRTYTCVCGDSYTEPVEKTAHTPGDWETVKEPTEFEAGKAIKKCTKCGEPMEEKVLPKLELLKSVALKDVNIDYKTSATLKPEINATSGIKATVTYNSSNPNVVSVDTDGNVKAVKKGTATITCTVTDQYGNTVKDTCKVTVNYTAWQWVIIILLFGWIWY